MQIPQFSGLVPPAVSDNSAHAAEHTQAMSEPTSFLWSPVPAWPPPYGKPSHTEQTAVPAQIAQGLGSFTEEHSAAEEESDPSFGFPCRKLSHTQARCGAS